MTAGDVDREHDAEITAARVVLTPLVPEDAEEMAGVLGDEGLHTFIGGRPATVDELRARYRALVAGSGDPAEVWRNWIVRLRADGTAIGTVQATITRDAAGGRQAHVAWVVGTAWQGRGFASEAAQALVGWLWSLGVATITAAIHPGHRASEVVATRAGLRATAEIVEGERLWST